MVRDIRPPRRRTALLAAAARCRQPRQSRAPAAPHRRRPHRRGRGLFTAAHPAAPVPRRLSLSQPSPRRALRRRRGAARARRGRGRAKEGRRARREPEQAGLCGAAGQFPALEYLAIASGREPELGARFAELPFEALAQLRYLDISSWTDEQRVWGGPDELRFMGHLHTLRWQGEMSAPLRACQLRRLSSARVKDEDLKALATCSQLVELATDSADIESTAALTAFTRLERLHLRHVRAQDLAPGQAHRCASSVSRRAKRPTSASSPSFPSSATSTCPRPLSRPDTFAHLRHLRRLDVGFTKVADLTPLRALGTLVDLDLHQTQVVDIAPLARLRLLKELNPLRDRGDRSRPAARAPRARVDRALRQQAPRRRRAAHHAEAEARPYRPPRCHRSSSPPSSSASVTSSTAPLIALRARAHCSLNLKGITYSTATGRP